MPVRLVTYDLPRPGQEYADLHDAIKQLGGGWWHCLDSTWMVTTHLSAEQVANKLAQFLDENDKVLVLDVSGDDWATIGLDSDCTNWMREQF